MIPLMSYTITALIHEAWAPANWAARGKGCGQLLIEAPPPTCLHLSPNLANRRGPTFQTGVLGAEGLLENRDCDLGSHLTPSLPVKIARESQALPIHPSFTAWFQLGSRSTSLGLCPQQGPRLGLTWGLVTRRPMPTLRARCRYRMRTLPPPKKMASWKGPQSHSCLFRLLGKRAVVAYKGEELKTKRDRMRVSGTQGGRKYSPRPSWCSGSMGSNA